MLCSVDCLSYRYVWYPIMVRCSCRYFPIHIFKDFCICRKREHFLPCSMLFFLHVGFLVSPEPYFCVATEYVTFEVLSGWSNLPVPGVKEKGLSKPNPRYFSQLININCLTRMAFVSIYSFESSSYNFWSEFWNPNSLIFIIDELQLSCRSSLPSCVIVIRRLNYYTNHLATVAIPHIKSNNYRGRFSLLSKGDDF